MKIKNKKRIIIITIIAIILFIINTLLVIKNDVRAEEKTETITHAVIGREDIQNEENWEENKKEEIPEVVIEQQDEKNIPITKTIEEKNKTVKVSKIQDTKKINKENLDEKTELKEDKNEKEKYKETELKKDEKEKEENIKPTIEVNTQNDIKEDLEANENKKEDTKDQEIKENLNSNQNVGENNTEQNQPIDKNNENNTDKEHNNEENQTNVNKEDASQEEPDIELNYIVLEDGTMENISNKIKETKTFNGIEITNIKITCNGNTSVLVADTTNITDKIIQGFLARIILLDKNKEKIIEISTYINTLEPNETRQINTSASYNFVNAYDIEFN